VGKYEKYVIQNPVDYGEKRYYPVGYWGPNVWFKGNVDFGGKPFTLTFIRVEHDMVMEEVAHNHDFDMWVWQLPLEHDNMEDLSCDVEMVFGSGTEDDPKEAYTLAKTGCFYIPAGVVHGPYTFKNVKKPILFIHAMTEGDYHKSEVFPEK